MSDIQLWPLAPASPPLEMPLLAAVMESSPDPWWVVRHDLALTHFNSAFRRLSLQLTAVDPAGGMRFEQMVDPARHGELAARWRDLYARVFAGRTVSADDWYLLARGSRYYSVSGTPVLVNGRIGAAAFHARDMTEWQHEVREDFLELALTRLFAEEGSLNEILAKALEFLCESDGWDAAIAWLVQPGETHLAAEVVFTGTLVNHDEFRRRLAGLTFPRGRGLPGRCWAGEELISIADLMEETGMARATIASVVGLHGIVAVPMLDAGRFIGVVELLTGPVRPLNEQHKTALRRSGASLAHLIARRRSEIERSDLLDTIKRTGTEWAVTFDSIEIPIFLTSSDGSIVRLNRAGRDFAGRRYKDLIGMRIDTVCGGEPWRTLGDVVSAVHDSGTACTAKIYDPAADRTWDVSGSLSRSSPHGEERLIIILREITALVRLQESVARGEQLAALGELVAGVAHQVRNPIFGISALLDSLEQRVDVADPDTTEIVEAMRRWLQRLSVLMEELLQYGQTWRLDLKAGDLAQVVRQAVEVVTPLGKQSNVRIETELVEGVTIMMDAGRLVQAFENLITNAIQHSPGGSTVTVSMFPAWEREDRIECRVRDRGPGFPDADLPRVFQPFFTRRRGGTGLGLSIVQRVIDEHGGTIAAGNDPEGGGVMAASFPIYEPAAVSGATE